jgi:hypothetical protein
MGRQTPARRQNGAQRPAQPPEQATEVDDQTYASDLIRSGSRVVGASRDLDGKPISVSDIGRHVQEQLASARYRVHLAGTGGHRDVSGPEWDRFVEQAESASPTAWMRTSPDGGLLNPAHIVSVDRLA